MNIAENLNRIAQAKADIKAAIIDKGVEVADTDKIDTYASKIADIQTGSNKWCDYRDMQIKVKACHQNRFDDDYPSLDTLNDDNTIYTVFDTREGDERWCFNVYLRTAGHITIEQGHLENGAFKGDDLLYQSTTAKTNHDTSENGMISSYYPFTIVRISATTPLKNWGVPVSAKGISNYNPQYNLKLVEAKGIGCNLDYINNSYTKWGTFQYTEKITVCEVDNTCKSLTSAFYGFNQLQELTFSNCDFSNVTSLTTAFSNNMLLQELDLSDCNFTKLTSMYSAFSNNYSIKKIKLGDLSSCQFTSIGAAFQSCYALKEIEGYKTINTTNCTSVVAFYACNSLEELDLSSWNITNKVTSFANMFSGCFCLKKLKIGTWDASSVKDVAGLFNSCSSLEFDEDLISKIENWNINITGSNNLSSMFLYCRNLKHLDLSGWTIASVTAVESMFNGCYALESVKMPNILATTSSFIIRNMFISCVSLKEIDLSNIPVNVTTATDSYNAFSGCVSVTKIKLFSGNYKVKNSYSMFGTCFSLKEIIGFEIFDFSECTSMYSMFSDCKSLKSVNLANFSIPAVCTRIDSLFSGCNSLETIEFNPNNTFDFTKITNYGGSIFYNCLSLEKIDMPFITNYNNVTGSTQLTYLCYNLKEINIPNLNLEKVTSSTYIFHSCYNLERINIAGFPKISFTIQSYCLSEEECINIFNKLATVSSKTLTLYTTVKNRLSAETIAIATQKGWTIA